MPDKQTDLVKTDFVNYLNSLGLSPRSHKNYRSDLGHFIAWAIFKVRSFGSYVETLAEIVPFLNNDLGHEYASYMTENLVPAKTINRRLSTLRHLSRFLQASHAIDNDFTKGIENISAVTVKKTVVDPAIGNFKAHLVNKNVSPNTIKNYLSDIRHFLVWLENNNQQLTNPMSLLPKITPDLIRKYQEDLTSHFSAATVRRKSISVGKFLDWAKSQGIIDSNLGDFFSTQKPVENIIPVKSAENSRFKNWYKTYRNIPGVMYLNIAVALILTSLVGLGIYNQFFKNAKSPLALTALNRPSRYLSFQGRLTNQYGNPVITSRDVVFKLYNDPGAGTTLWDSGTCTVLPDADGVFSILLGSTCGTELTSSVFSDNAGVWLGVKVASDAEATPRVQIATVAYALNSETLQGYPASSSATINTIPVINNSGQMVLASSSPKIQSTSGTFAIEGQALTISTPSTSNGNVTVSPDGTGQLNLTFSGASPGSGTGMVNATDANLTSGALYYGSVASNATGYDLLQLQSGSSPTTTKFSVNDAGKTYIAGNLGIGTTNPGAKLEVAGQVKITGGSPGSNKVLTSDTVGLASWADLSTLPVGNADTTDNYHISSATTNYLTKYTDSTHLGASGIFEVSGNVGIGTTGPMGTLDVNGTIFLKGNSILESDGTNHYFKSPSYLYFQSGGSTSGYISNFHNLVMNGTGTFGTNAVINGGGVSYFNGGNVGIGTTGPNAKLDVNGNVIIANPSGEAYLTLGTNNVASGFVNSVNSLYFNTDSDNTETGTNFIFGTNRAGTAGGTELMRIQENGNVGIGTTGPGAKLEVNGNAIIDGYIQSYSTTPYVDFYQSGVQEWKVGQLTAGNSRFTIQATGAANPDVFSILANGNVGIGTTAPLIKLDVNGGVNIAGGLLVANSAEMVTNGTFDTNTNGWAGGDATVSVVSGVMRGTNTYAWGGWAFTSPDIKVVAGRRYKLTLTCTGASVACGVMAGSSDWTDNLLSHTALVVGVPKTFYITATNTVLWIGLSIGGVSGDTADFDNISLVEVGDIITPAEGFVGPSSTAGIYFKSGNIGIGTTGPGAPFEVSSTNFFQQKLTYPAAGSLSLGVNSSGIGVISRSGGFDLSLNSSGYAGFGYSDAGTAQVAINGNVGIGTTSPGYKLDVSGSGRFTGALNVGTATGTNEGSLNLAGAYAGISLASQTGSGATWSIYDSAGTLNYYNGGASSKVVFDTNGNVGIGTTSPTAKLYISSSTGNLFTINDTVGDLVNVSSAQTTINNPTFFTSSGDVSITYDLLFSNSDSSYIKSVASLYIQAGETYDSSDLTLRTFNSGDIVMDAGGVTSATGTVRFNDSNVKGATVTTPIGFAAASSDINTFRTNFTNETVIGSINEAYAAAIGGGGGLWLDGGSYAYPNSAYVTDVMVPSGNVGIGTTSPGSKLDVQSADNTGATNIGSFYASNRTQAVGIGFQDVRQQAAGVQLNVNAGTSGILYLGNTSTGGVNIGAGGGGVNMTGAVTGGTYNGQTISSAANFTGSLTMAGTFTRDTMRYITESRSLTQTAGDWVNVGSFANNGVGNFGKITVYTHTSGTIQMASYSFAHDAYSGGSSATWIELPPDGPNSLYGDAQTVAVDVYNADRNSTSSPIEVRLRNKTGFGATAGVTVLIETNAAFTASTTSGSGATAANGYLGSKQWMFPTSTGPWNATTDGLYILSSGNVGIGTTSPAGKLQIDTDTTTGGTALILKTNNSTTANSAILWRNNADVTKSGIGSSYNVGDTGNMEFMTGGATTNMIITSGGNVGIGTTSPGANLQVNSTTGTGMIRVSGVGEGSSDIGGIEFLHSSYNANPIASIVMHRTPTAASGTLAFRTAYTGTPADRLTISAWGAVGIGYDASAITDAGNLLISGNVGIGTTSPTELLHLYGTGNVRNYLQTTSGAAVAISFYQNADRAWSSGIRGDISDGYSIRDESVATDRLFINTSGNVGIGTTSPGAKLQVYNASAGQAIFSGWDNVGGAQTYNGSIALGDTAAYQGIIHYNGAGVADLYIDNTYSSSAIGKTMFRMQTAGTPITAMTINGSGNVGIGTTNPQSRLHVSSLGSGDGNLVQRWSYNGGDGDYYLDLKQTVTSGVVRWNFSQLNATTPYNDVLVLDRGNVGIGTTNPGAKLEVAGTIKIVDGSQGANEVLTSDANGLASWQPVGTAMITDDSLDFTKFEDTMDLDANLILNQAAYTWTQNYTGTTTNGYTYNANSLTSGTGMVLSSTSTALSTGGLMSLDWSPASSTTSTGDLLSLNIGTNGNIGNIFNVKDSGSSLFSVSETAVTSNLPTSFTSPGDITVAYDLNFTNPTASYIKSSAPLYLQAGEVFNSSDLTLKTFNSGNIVMDAGGSTSATGTVLFNDSNVKGATVTTPIGFAAASSDINTFRTNFTNETVIGSINEAYSAAIGGGGGIWTDAGTYIYPTAGGATAMAIMDNGNVGIGTTAPSALLDVAGKIESSTFQMTTGGAASYFMQSDASGNASWVAPSSISIGNADTLDTYHGGAAGSYVMSGVAGNWDVASSAVTSSYPYGALEIREAQFGGAQTGVAAEAPRISFHWSGRVASQIGMDLNGVIRTYDNPGTSYEAFAASRIDIGATNVIDASRNLVNVGTITAAGAVNAPNFRDSTGDYNVNLGSGGIEGRGLVAGYSGGAYGGIGYNIRHTGTTGTYIAPTADTASYIRFTNAGFEFLGAAGGSAGRTLSLASANLTASTYTSNVATGTAPLTVSSTTTVSNLSADLIDGIQSNRIVYGDGARGKSTQVSTMSDLAQPSGFYYGYQPTGAPVSDWMKWITLAGDSWTDPDGYALQLAQTFWSDSLYMRRLQSGTWYAWQKLLSSADISGTTNYVAKFTGANSLGDSTIFDNGNVGIGTTGPTEKLDIAGNLRFSGALMPNNAAGTSGQFLISAGTGAPPTWTATVPATSVPFSGITSGTNVTAAMVVGTGASLTYHDGAAVSGEINASLLQNANWAAPLAIGGTTANTGAFTTLTAGANSYRYNTSQWAYSMDAGANNLFSYAGSMPSYDVFEYATVNSVEYYSGGWTTWSGSNMENAFDHNVQTGVTVDATHQNFRFVIDHGSYSCQGLYIIERSYASPNPDYTITIETDDNTGFTSPTTIYSGSALTSQEMSAISANSCNADEYLRMQINSTQVYTLLEISALATRGSNGANLSAYKQDYNSPYVSSGLAVGYSNGQTVPSNGLVISGNVGIGTVVPRGKLEVVSGSANTDADPAKEMTVVGPNNAMGLESGNLQIATNDAVAANMGGSIAFGARYSGTAQANFAVIKAGLVGSYGGYLTLGTRPDGGVMTEWIRIKSDGNVGIGTTNPGYKLDVSGTARITGVTIINGGSSSNWGGLNVGGSIQNSGSIYSYDSVCVGNASGGCDSTGGVVLGRANGTVSLTTGVSYFNGGNVGIGTTSPVVNFQVGAAATSHSLSTNDALFAADLELDGVLYLDGRTITSSNGTSTITFPSDPTTAGAYNLLTNGSWMIQNPSAGNPGLAALMVDQIKGGDIFTASASGAPKFVINNSGNVGIGTTSPSTRLEISGAYDTGESRLTFIGTGVNAGWIGPDSSARALRIYAANSDLRTFTVGNTWMRSNAAHYIDLDDDNNGTTDKLWVRNGADGTIMVAEEAGNVGIGTDSPATRLSVIGGGISTDSFYSFTSVQAVAPPGHMTYINAPRSLNLGLFANGVEALTINSSHYVGIGTTSPLQKLHVDGRVYIAPVLNSGNTYEDYRGFTVNTGTMSQYASLISSYTTDTVADDEYSFASGTCTSYDAQGDCSGGASKFTVSTSGKILAAGVYGTTVTSPRNVYVDSSGNFGGISSSLRFKQNILDMGEQSDKLYQLRPVTFEYKSNPGTNEYGLIAEEMVKIFPELTYFDDQGLPSGIAYDRLPMIELNEIIKHQNSITNLQSGIATLSGQLANLSLTSTGDLNISQDVSGNYQLTNTSDNSIISQIAALGQLVAANIKAGAITTTDFVAENVNAGAVIASRITTDGFTAFQGTVDNLLIRSGLVAGNIQTKLISPLADGTDVTVQIGTATESGKFAVQNSAGTEVASIDNQGNASFSGTLYADEIKSKSLDEIQALLTKVQTDQALLAEAATWNINTATNSASLNELAVADLYITNQAAINSLSVSTVLTVGSDMVFQSTINNQQLTINSIDTLTAPLKLQSLAMAPLEIMAGLVTIDTHGNVNIAGNLFVAGKIHSSGLALTQSTQDQLNGVDATDSGKLLTLQDQAGTEVASVNASGSAQFNSLSTQGLTIAGADATQSGIIVNGIITTNSTAGKATIPTGVSEITIKNPKVTDYTLVYVTPTSSTQNNVLYVKSKEAGQFVVGFAYALDADVSFNWWIIQTNGQVGN